MTHYNRERVNKMAKDISIDSYTDRTVEYLKYLHNTKECLTKVFCSSTDPETLTVMRCEIQLLENCIAKFNETFIHV